MAETGTGPEEARADLDAAREAAVSCLEKLAAVVASALRADAPEADSLHGMLADLRRSLEDARAKVAGVSHELPARGPGGVGRGRLWESVAANAHEMALAAAECVVRAAFPAGTDDPAAHVRACHSDICTRLRELVCEWDEEVEMASDELAKTVSVLRREIERESRAAAEAKLARVQPSLPAANASAPRSGETPGASKPPQDPTDDWHWVGLPDRLERLAKALDAAGGKIQAKELMLKLEEQPSAISNDYKKHRRWGRWFRLFIGCKSGLWWLNSAR